MLAKGGDARRQRRAAAEALERHLREPHQAANGRGGRAHVDGAGVLPCTSRRCQGPDAPGLYSIRMHAARVPTGGHGNSSAVHSALLRRSPAQGDTLWAAMDGAVC